MVFEFNADQSNGSPRLAECNFLKPVLYISKEEADLDPQQEVLASETIRQLPAPNQIETGLEYFIGQKFRVQLIKKSGRRGFISKGVAAKSGS